VDVRKIATDASVLRQWRGRVTAVIGGPPCQGFSSAGPRKPLASRNFIYRALADVAKAVRARVLVMENVPGLKRVNGVRFAKRILRDFATRGYVGASFEVDATDFGVPQRRKRLFFVCTRRRYPKIRIRMRASRSTAKCGVLDAFDGLPRARAGEGGNRFRVRGKLFHNHRAMTHSKAVVRKIRKIKAGKGPISYRRLRRDYAHTIVAGHRAMPVHPRQHRTITVREAARLQTLPDDFHFLGPHANQPLQVANTVPYRLARGVARALSAELKRIADDKD